MPAKGKQWTPEHRRAFMEALEAKRKANGGTLPKAPAKAGEPRAARGAAAVAPALPPALSKRLQAATALLSGLTLPQAAALRASPALRQAMVQAMVPLLDLLQS